MFLFVGVGGFDAIELVGARYEVGTLHGVFLGILRFVGLYKKAVCTTV